MALFNLKKNDRITVNVIDQRQFSNKSIYEVEYNGRKCQVPMFEFQRGLPMPETMECVVQSVTDSSLYLQQNIAELLKQNYQIGKTYEFTVAQDYTTTSTPHYKLTDGSGFFFKLPVGPTQRFTKNRRIRCRINRIRGVEVDLIYVGIAHEAMESFKLDVLTDKIGLDASSLLAYFRHIDGADDIRLLYEDGNPEWLPRAINHAIDHFAKVTPTEVTVFSHRLITNLHNCVVWFLEDSDYFDKFPETDRYQWQNNFGRSLRRIDALSDAYSYILSGRQQEYINRVVNKFKISGYLIDATHKLLTLRSVLSIDPRGFNNVIDDLLNVVVERHGDCMREPTFRRSFIDLLQLYVDHNHSALDEIDEAETPDARKALHTMIRVLAIQLLLAADDEEHPLDSDEFGIDFDINRSRLYRYLTLQNNSGDDELIDKSLMALLASEQWRTEYTWADVDDAVLLSLRLRQPGSVATLPATYETPTAALRVSEDAIELSDTLGEETQEVFPANDSRLWQDMKIMLSAPLPANLRQPRTIPQFRRFWQEVERRLTDSDSARNAVAERLVVPARGQDVEIEIYDIDPTRPDTYLCRVVEMGMKGSGSISKQQITTSNQEFPYSIFTDDSGNPLVFNATVIGGSDDKSLQFSLIDTLDEYFNSIINYDDIDDCVILKKLGDSCTVLSRRGFTLNVELDSDHDYLETGDVIKVSNINIDGNWREGDFIAEAGGHLDFVNIFRSMLRDFALKDAPADEELSGEGDASGALQEAIRLDEASVIELIRLIESIASKVRENRLAYNYYAYARMLARMIADDTLTSYFDKRCQLLEEFDDFSTNGHVNLEHINSLMADLVKQNNSLSNDGEKLRILSVLDHPENNSYLWQLFNSSASESLQELARLVVAYNMLDGFKMAHERQEIRKKLYDKLKINIENPPTVVAGGTENLTTEFKTSIAYPANSMRLDLQAQTAVILKVITAFLNTCGGTLYVGVSDEGYVRGLESDLAYFRSRDSFDRHVHDNIRKHLTFIPNRHDYIETGWIEAGGKEIYVVKVRPIFEPIAVDGVYYYREGSSCVMVRAEQEKQFIESRKGASGAETSGSEEDTSNEAPATSRSALPIATTASEPVADTATISTSEFRNRVLHEGYEGYEPISEYLYVFSDGTFEISAIDRWQEESAALTLGLHPEELAGNLVVVGCDGYALRVAADSLTNSDRHFSTKSPACFIAPISDDDRLIIIYRSADGDLFKRIFSASDIRVQKVGARGEKLDSAIGKVLFCEIVPPSAQASFKSLTRERRIGKDQFDAERNQIMARLSKD